MYSITFQFGKLINLGRCVITAQDDTTLSQYWTTTEDGYRSFSVHNLIPGEKIYYNDDDKTLLSTISTVTSSTITLTSNPGQRAYNKVLKDGYIIPFVERENNIYSYQKNKFLNYSFKIFLKVDCISVRHS